MNLELFFFKFVVRMVIIYLKNSDTRGVSGQVLVIPSTGKGNIGDEAMLNGILEKLPKDSSIFLDFADSYDSDFLNIGSQKLLRLHNVFDVKIVSNYLNLIKLLNESSQKNLVVMIGADIISGNYSKHYALKRLIFVNELKKLGVNVAITPSTFHKITNREIVKQLRLYSLANPLYVRDNHSISELNAIGITHCKLSADIAFRLTGFEEINELQIWIKQQRRLGRKLAAYNLSGLQINSEEFVARQLVLCKSLVDLGYSICFIPHVYRTGDDDLQAILDFVKIFEIHDLPTIQYLVNNSKLSVWQIRSVLRECDVVISARMHLLISACSLGIPIISTSSESKFLELLKDFNILQNLLAEGFPIDLIPNLLFEQRIRETKSRIQNRLPSVLNRLDSFESELRRLSYL